MGIFSLFHLPCFRFSLLCFFTLVFFSKVVSILFELIHLLWPFDSSLEQEPVRTLESIRLQIENQIFIGRFGSSSKLVDHVQCVVCLNKVEDGEEIAELKCKHVFHRDCLNRWIGFRNFTCPLCRESLFPATAVEKMVELEETEDEILFVLSSTLSSPISNSWLVW